MVMRAISIISRCNKHPMLSITLIAQEALGCMPRPRRCDLPSCRSLLSSELSELGFIILEAKIRRLWMIIREP